MVKGIIFGTQFVALHAHYGLIRPTPWTNRNGDVPLVGHDAQCRAGYTGRSAPAIPGYRKWAQREPVYGTNCFFYQNWTRVPDDEQLLITPTNFKEFHTFGNSYLTDRLPWTAPGTAPIDSPCGVDGGNLHGCWTGNGYGPGNPNYKKMKGVDNPEMNTEVQCFYGGYGQGEDARVFDFPDVQTTYVNAGGDLQGSWGLHVNHGGGYAYRLCRLIGDVTKETVTEECFRQGHLNFSDPTHSQVRHLYADPVTIPSPIFNGATGPWKKNPIAPCKNWGASYEKCEPLFQPPKEAPGMYGASHSRHGDPGRDWQVMDSLHIDDRFPPGRYVLSFRFDAQGTPQVWMGCSDIEVLPAGAPLPTPPPSAESDEGEGEWEPEIDEGEGERDPEGEVEPESEGDPEGAADPEGVADPEGAADPEAVSEDSFVCSKENYHQLCTTGSFKPNNKIVFNNPRGSRTTSCYNIFEGEGGWVYTKNSCTKFRDRCCKETELVSINKHVQQNTKFSGHMKDNIKERVVVEADGSFA